MTESDNGERDKPGGENGPPNSPWPALWESVGQKLVTLLISAGSLVGFVAFAGSVVLWSRFFAIDVPPDQVVAAVPRGESVAVGSVMLLLFGFFGALATLAVYLIDRGGRATPGMSRALLLILTVEAAVAIWIAGDSSAETKVIASEILAITFAAALWSTFVGGLVKLEARLPDLKREDEPTQKLEETPFWKEGNKTNVTVRGVLAIVAMAVLIGGIAFCGMWIFDASANWRWIIALGVGGVCLLLAIGAYCWRFQSGKAEDEASGQPKIGKPPQIELTMWGSAVIVILAVIAAAIPSIVLGEWWLGVSLGIVFLIGCGLWRIAWLANKRFIWLGMAVFISVPLFGALMLMVRNLAEPQVQALALIRSGDGPDEAIQGLYVTEASDRVYFANVATEGCSDQVTPASGRLLWVRKDEVVAMSIGPLEDVGDAGTTALEMAYALTPAVETPAGDHVSLTLAEKRAGKTGVTTPTGEAGKAAKAGTAEKAEKTDGSKGLGATPAEKKVTLVAPAEGRLEDPGPAVRPNFGAGLRLDPETASPGEEVTLTMSAPNENDDVEGFGSSRAGHNLRLGGVIADIAKGKALNANRAEYIEVGPSPGGSEERLLNLAKGGAYILKEDEFRQLDDTAQVEGKQLYVRLRDRALREVNGKPVSAEEEVYVKVERSISPAQVAEVGIAEVVDVKKTTGARLAMTATLAAGNFEGRPQQLETIDLAELSLYRQAWQENRIRFRVPENAKSGVVTVECGQLAGSPLLRVSHTPTARIAVRIQANSQAVRLDSSGSGDEDGERITRRWTVEGIPRGHRPEITTQLPLRPGAYAVKLTVADEAGHVDTAALRLLRLPNAMFDFGKSEPDERSLKAIRAARRALRRAVVATSPIAIELHGHADNPGAASFNLGLSLQRNDDVREELMPEPKVAVEGGLALPVEELAYGESCPIDSGTGRRPRNRRVEVFVVNEGVTVRPARGCTPSRLKHTSWYPLASEAEP